MELQFPRITIDYINEIGDVVDIVRDNKSWRITFDYNTENVVYAAVRCPDSPDPVMLDITNIKDEPTVVQQTIARVLMEIIYIDYTDEMKMFIVAGPKRSNITQKTFDIDIKQPVISAENEVVDPMWRATVIQDGVVHCVIKRHKDYPDVFHISFLNIPGCIAIYPDENHVMQLAKPSYKCGDPNALINLTITPVIGTETNE